MEPYLGEIRIFAGNFAPQGWAFCDGQLLAVSQNDALFSLLGTQYGGDGRTTFGLPDFRGRVPIHQGTGPGLSPHRIGEKNGTESVTLNVSQLPTHNHNLLGNSGSGTSNTPQNAFFSQAEEDIYHTSTDVSMGATTDEGGNGSHPNMQPYLALNYIIALVGVYPSRT